MNGVLTEAQKAEVVARYMAGETMTYLADQYSVTRPAIRGILLRRPSRLVLLGATRDTW